MFYVYELRVTAGAGTAALEISLNELHADLVVFDVAASTRSSVVRLGLLLAMLSSLPVCLMYYL